MTEQPTKEDFHSRARPRRIRSEKELPQWFRLEKYEAAQNLGLEGWYWQIAARKDIYQHYVWYIPDEVLDEWHGNEQRRVGHKEDNRLLRELWESLQTAPIFDSSTPEFNEKYRGRFVFNRRAGVNYATLEDVRSRLAGIDDPDGRVSNYFLSLDRHSPPKPIKPCPLERYIKDSLYNLLLSVNLDVPERILVENFTEIIRRAKAMRADEDLEEWNFRRPDFNEWIRIGLLPYLDLKIWELIANVTMPNRVMAYAIFPPGEGGEEVVRKTTEKLGQKILDGNMPEILAGLRLGAELNE